MADMIDKEDSDLSNPHGHVMMLKIHFGERQKGKHVWIMDSKLCYITYES